MIGKGDLKPDLIHIDQIAINFHLWTFVSKMTVFSALKASNLIQRLETMGPPVTLEKFFDTFRNLAPLPLLLEQLLTMGCIL